MLSTLVFGVVLLSLVVGPAVIWAFLLKLGLRWAKAEDVTGRRVVFATIVVFLLQLSGKVGVYLIFNMSPNIARVLVVDLVLSFLVPPIVIAKVFSTTAGRSLQAGLPTLAAPIIVLALVMIVLRPLVYEAFVTSTNSMAPTLLGNHLRNPCKTCGEPAYCSPNPNGDSHLEPPWMICQSNLHVTQMTEPTAEAVGAADRILVAKFLQPERWDLVTFKYPENPAATYVMRLVGLPGEVITIRDNQVCADGEKLTPPDSIRGIEYVSDVGDWLGPIWGSERRPAQLGEDEYFVLGDFSKQAKDSRLWERGATGHNPFAVPETHLTGVVTHIYWPPSRWRVIR